MLSTGGSTDNGIPRLTLESLFEVWGASTRLNPDELIRETVPKLADLTGADRVSLMRVDSREGVLTVHTAAGLPSDTAAGARVPLGEPIAGWVAQEGRAVLLPGGPSLPPSLRAALSRDGIVSALCVPLKSRTGTLGVLNLTRLRGRRFTRRHLRFVALLGERLASSLEVAHLYDELAERHFLYNAVVECATELVVSLGLDGRILSWNRAAEAVTGLPSDRVIGMPVHELCAGGCRDAMIDLVRRVRRGVKVQHAEIPLRTREQRDVPVRWSGAPLTVDDDQIIGIVAVGRDVTEQRRLEAQLIQSAKMASLGVMASGIAHELRNPLAVASAAAQLTREQPDDEVLRAEALEKIRVSVERASSIIEGLLTFARPVEGRLRMVQANDLVQNTCRLMRDQMTSQHIAVHAVLASDLPRVEADRGLLQQVFVNLMLNARHAMPEGGTLSVSTDTDERGWVRIRFVDTGVGIQPDHLPKVFDPFFTTRPAGEGMGLGLTISYRIIERFNGTIDLASEGAGTTATVCLPPAC